ncbi:hypothetical protein [Aminirod propionatiphilus]|uniref:hypothetical protein n=1 Tax=Aminirod propionatiphilus TaxID=3415223 RepID=UPI003BFA7046
MKRAAFVSTLLTLFCLLCFPLSSEAVALPSGFPSEALAQRKERFLFRMEIPLSIGAETLVRLPSGEIFHGGKVLALPGSSKWPAYTASRWARPGTVAATAVNAIHLLLSVEEERGRTISLLPGETFAPAAGEGNAVVIDVPAGKGFFGAWAPTVGSAVTIMARDGSLRPLNAQTPPLPGERLIVDVVERPGPYMVEIDNRPGGDVLAWIDGYGARKIASVVRPLGGVGRFGGSQFQSPSRLRANHTGVVCISTSPRGDVGGFQILPLLHAHSPEMKSAWELTQWLIVEPVDDGDLVGTAPLFSDYLVPGPAEDESLWDLWSTYGRRSLVLCRLDDGPWRKLPVLVGRDDGALKAVTRLKIYFPWTSEPGK